METPPPSSTFLLLLSILLIAPPLTSAAGGPGPSCRSFCGNITVDYPFALHDGCGHPGFRDLLFCINSVLMFHIASGSYRVLDIDYPYRSLTLHDPHLSTCDDVVLSPTPLANGFVLDPSRSPYFSPSPDNVFMLIGCSPTSPLFQGFPGKHLPCRNVSGMGCEEYYGCEGWSKLGSHRRGSESGSYGSTPPECCAVSFEAIKAINLTRLECQGYSSAYTLAPLRVDGPAGWSYGIRVKYSVQGSEEFCRACEATGGSCGFGSDGERQLCMCPGFNSTSNCDKGSIADMSASVKREVELEFVIATWAGLLLLVLAWMA
ncbi:unnamed protein product [Linum trigynum]|uniref:Wall-associated receptor kinase galacturonan-binding domain-containing protein n=1 Tax=Linum trigynum TaxID=586398 RepID=A0AAV2G3J2_9ROSI